LLSQDGYNGLVNTLPQKVMEFRSMQARIRKRIINNEKERSVAKSVIVSSVKRIQEAIEKRGEELIREVDYRCENEKRLCDVNLKTAREMHFLTAYVSWGWPL
jgi:CRISPR/Cas system CMR subunit Cmr6 (Cas7 group RAMP superfamily)